MDLGGPLLRIMGDAATTADVREVLDALLTHPEVRGRCDALSSLVQEVPLDKRQQYCAAMVVTLGTQLLPREDPAVDATGEIDVMAFKPTTASFAVYCCPLQHSAWGSHVEGRWKPRGGIEFANISPYFYEIVAALEALWNVQGHLLKRD
jgi:hypothetical protein